MRRSHWPFCQSAYSLRAVLAFVAVFLAASCGRWKTITLHKGESKRLLTFESSDSAEVVLEMDLLADVDWGERDRESAVLRISLDGRRNHDVLVVHSPARSQTLLGPVSAGKHVVGVQLDPWLTAARIRQVRIREARVRLFTSRDSLYAVIANAPLLYGRPGNEHTDAPLLAWHEVARSDSGMKILYSVIWSNEDGGTDTDDLLSRWGRTTDIEWIYEIRFDPDGRIVSEVFQGPGHKTTPFGGRKRGANPLLRTCTLNNNVCDRDSSQLLFALAPFLTRFANQPREHLMDLEPWTYAVMAAELRREGKLESRSDPRTPKPGDLRDFLLVDFETAGKWSDVDLVFAAQDRDGRWYACNHGIDSVQCVNAPGPRRTSIEMPAGWRIEWVRGLRLEAKAEGPFRVEVRRVERVFQLDGQWRPRVLPWHWEGMEVLTPDRPSIEWDLTRQQVAVTRVDSGSLRKTGRITTDLLRTHREN